MKIGIIGTRGIPNHYGGFEQFAQYLSKGLVEKGHDVWVYNSHLHPYQENTWNGVNIVHCKDFEDVIGTAGQFFYDLNCILDSRKKEFDVILQLGYTSSSVWYKFLPGKPNVFTNMDGLEWKRSKFSKLVQSFLRKAEFWAVKSSDFLIADSIGVQDYLNSKYDKKSTYIPYGADVFNSEDKSIIEEFNVIPYNYHILVARLEPENNIETILEGYNKSESTIPFIVIGKTENSFGKYLIEKFSINKNIIFLGGVYDIKKLNNLRCFSNMYFHGHSVGGTNPSLLEAMASNSFVVAHDNIFNKSILNDDALYFTNSNDVTEILNSTVSTYLKEEKIDNNIKKIKSLYSWDKIVNDYENLFLINNKK